jgi:nitrogen fixation/metabolism regulation signal transduction histidine kinase
MAFSRFEVGLAWRTLVLVLAVWLLVEAIAVPNLRAGRVVAALIAFAALANLWAFIRRTNFQVARFIESVRFEDYAQRFSDPSGGGFDVLGETLDRALKALQERHVLASSEARFLTAIVDDSPSALLAINEDGRVQMLNKAARQLFGRIGLTRVADLAALGPELAAAAQLPPGSRKITRLLIDGVPHRAIFASAHVARLEGGVTVLSILPVQSELGALEVAAQADLVRVLTHEIMNSLTPVTSLARSGAEMVAAAEARGADLGDARVATETVARRAEGLLRFVESYREFAQKPEVHRQSIPAKAWAQDILQLAMANAGERHVEVSAEVKPESLRLQADPELLAQALLNLLRNALRVVANVERPMIRLAISRERGGRVRIEVRDNGPGIPSERREDIFLPFYTTHHGGSGVGLSFARQVALAHGGSISAGDAPEGGACLIMVV